MEIAQYGGGVEAVDEETRAARPVGVLEQVEELESAGVRLRDTRLDERERERDRIWERTARTK